MMAPKPDLVPLTAGYRRAPVLQIGADISTVIRLLENLREIDRRHPGRRCIPTGSVAWYRRSALGGTERRSSRPRSWPPASSATRPAGLHRRAAGLDEPGFHQGSVIGRSAANLTRMHAAMALLTEQLQGRQFVLGDALLAADLTAYHMLWFARKNGGAELEAMLPLDPLRDWMNRVASFGHGSRHAMDAQAALDVAREATPETPRIRADGDPSGLRAGERVVVQADDYARDPVHGTLVAADAEELVIRHDNERVGRCRSTFPVSATTFVPFKAILREAQEAGAEPRVR